MLLTIKCPNCSTNGTMSLLNSTYQIAYRCWKCREFFNLSVEDNEVKSIIKLTPEEYQKMKEVEDLRSKFKRQV